MKKKYIILSAVLVGMGLGLSSCADQLDADRYFKDRMSLEDVFSSRDYSEEWLANAFVHLTGSNAMFLVRDILCTVSLMICTLVTVMINTKNGKTENMMKAGNKVHGERAIPVFASLYFYFEY